ncbi:PREDICTED: uncharacterized protein LOC105454210 [Wasmannia auropunctata]|uniref:uncharacterized protein LOC105454210 n=1 Tax=Wasmannia auropunctata TaxID=64793 RepID=UPI0005EDFDA2|nr:PREDICTED: uncharacterized protein LOC105454210 [Wasmannia auropunctata]
MPAIFELHARKRIRFPPSRGNETRDDIVTARRHFRISNRCPVRTLAQDDSIPAYTRRKRAPARDTEINAILRGVITPPATVGVFIERRAAASSFSIRAIKRTDVDGCPVSETSR